MSTTPPPRASNPAAPDASAGTGQPGQPGKLQPDTTSVNEVTYAAAPVSTTELVPTDVSDEIRETTSRPRPTAPSLDYTLIRPANYETIIGGVAPSPFVAFLVLLGLLGLVGAAFARALGAEGAELWVLGGLFLLIGATLAAFVSRSA